MSGPIVCLASQTPPARFRVSHEELAERYPGIRRPLSLDALEEGVDFTWTTGGVPVMLRQLLACARELGIWDDATWISLNPAAPHEYLLGETRVVSVALDAQRLERYAEAKEKMWAEIHDLPRVGSITPRELEAFAAFNWRTSQAMFEHLPDSDVGFVHDFQLLQTGGMIGLSAPVVLRWHIPFTPAKWSPYFRTFVVRAVESFDAVVVSCRRDLEGLVRSGYRGIARQVYPYVDLETVKRATPEAKEALAGRLALPDEAPMVLCVARMDPMKGQDRLVEAMAIVARKIPEARLVLVGNGSFTSAGGQGLGQPKGARWRKGLETLVHERKLDGRVTFTGYLPPELLDAAWERANVVVQPSLVEGFGLTAIEAWQRERPVVVSRGAGASELVLEGVNGHTYDPSDVEGLANHILSLLAAPDVGAKMGRRGRETAQRCALPDGARAETAVLEEAIAGFVPS